MRSFDVLYNLFCNLTAIAAAGAEEAGDAAAQPASEGLHAVFGPIIDAVKPYTLEPLDRMLDSIPMGVAQVIVIGLFVVSGILTCCVHRKFIYLGAPDQKPWRDLRIWSVLLLVPYIAVYVVFGR